MYIIGLYTLSISFLLHIGLVASSSKGMKRKQPEASGVGTSGSKKAKLW